MLKQMKPALACISIGGLFSSGHREGNYTDAIGKRSSILQTS